MTSDTSAAPVHADREFGIRMRMASFDDGAGPTHAGSRVDREDIHRQRQSTGNRFRSRTCLRPQRTHPTSRQMKCRQSVHGAGVALREPIEIQASTRLCIGNLEIWMRCASLLSLRENNRDAPGQDRAHASHAWISIHKSYGRAVMQHHRRATIPHVDPQANGHSSAARYRRHRRGRFMPVVFIADDRGSFCGTHARSTPYPGRPSTRGVR